MMRVRQALLLIVPLLRTTAWPAVAAAAALGLATFGLGRPPQLAIRLAAVALCVGAAFTLDDAAARIAASSPTPLLFRRLLRVALAVALVSVLWPPLLIQDGVVPDSGATLELGAMLSATLAVAAFVGGRHPSGPGGPTAAVALPVALAVAAIALPESWPLFAAGPDDPHWDAAIRQWAAVLVLGTVVLVYASRDPARSPIRARPPGRREPRGRADTTDVA